MLVDMRCDQHRGEGIEIWLRRKWCLCSIPQFSTSAVVPARYVEKIKMRPTQKKSTFDPGLISKK